MSAFFERVRAALAPKGYDVLRELASGGMGTVFLARQVNLDRLVAVKVLRPALATARGADQFEREARTLASLSHPNIVPVHDVGESAGLFFYVMDHLRGETVADRLDRKRLSRSEALKLGRDLLDALEAAHRAGVAHRDVKPANFFIEARRGVLTDFGIARRIADVQRWDPRVTMGTAAYMAPELFAGVEANERSDIYAAGMVIYEVFSGRLWDKVPPDHGDWSGVPHNVGRVLRRAVDLDPQRRWPDAAAFRRALWHTRVWPYRRNTIAVAIGGTVLGLALSALWPESRTTAWMRVEAEPAPPGLPGWLGDSLACGFARILDRYPALSARCVSGLARLWGHGERLRLQIANESGLARVRVASGMSALDTIAARGRPAEWETLAGDLGDRAFGALLNTRSKLLDPSLPAAVLPKSREGLLAFGEAEQRFAQARWGEARAAYGAAAALDSTCWLCFWRHAEVGRWFDLQDDPRDSARYFAHLDAFPAYYQSLIGAQRLPETERLDSLEALTRRWKDFLFGQFRRGDELLHRGPLVGRPRREAMAPFDDVLKYQPAFGPALQHVAWVHIAEGDSADATAALGRINPLEDPHDPSFATIALVQLAYAWRFLPRAQAAQRTGELVRAAQAAGVTQLDAGARYLSGFGTPEGALAFGERLLREPGFERSASIARVLASVGLGRPDSGLALARALESRFPELGVFADELAAAILLFDADSALFASRWLDVRLALSGAADQPAGPSDRRRRARWMLELGERAWRARAHPEKQRDPPLPHAMAALLQSSDLAARGAYDSALVATEVLTGILAQLTDDPFFRTVLHFRRADWYERIGQPQSAASELRWHENSDLYGYPTGDPQPAEVDWAFAPLAEWRLAALLERAGGRVADKCRAYRTVARLWATGEALYRARADSATRRLAELSCGANA
jgi:hypothetical protein